MRDTKSIVKVVNAITGIITGSDATGGTCTGVSIDTLGFGDILGIVTMGAVLGTAAAPAELTVAFQEGDAATGPFTAIGTGAINGTMQVKLNVLGAAAATNTAQFMTSVWEKLRDNNRKRYVRVLATLKGTAGANVSGPFSVSVLLGRPQSTLWIGSATSIATGNNAYYAGFQNYLRA